MRILVLVNDPGVPPGRLTDVAHGLGHQLVTFDAYGGQPFPPVDGFDGVVALGGRMGAYDEEAYSFLVDEKRFLADAVERNVPVLGLCLGGQLLADALGGEAYLADTPEVVFDPVCVLDSDDATVTALASGRIIRYHQDTWDAPPGAKVVATGGGYDQAFRYGSALAVQPHPEVTQQTLVRWATDPDSVELRRRAGADGDALVKQVNEADEEMAQLAHDFFSAWFAEVQRTSHGG